jgi:hypothetical protein
LRYTISRVCHFVQILGGRSLTESISCTLTYPSQGHRKLALDPVSGSCHWTKAALCIQRSGNVAVFGYVLGIRDDEVAPDRKRTSIFSADIEVAWGTSRQGRAISTARVHRNKQAAKSNGPFRGWRPLNLTDERSVGVQWWAEMHSDGGRVEMHVDSSWHVVENVLRAAFLFVVFRSRSVWRLIQSVRWWDTWSTGTGPWWSSSQDN